MVSTEYALFNDQDCVVERGFGSFEAAALADQQRYSPAAGLTVGALCATHNGQAAVDCAECFGQVCTDCGENEDNCVCELCDECMEKGDDCGCERCPDCEQVTESCECE